MAMSTKYAVMHKEIFYTVKLLTKRHNPLTHLTYSNASCITETFSPLTTS